MVHDIVCVVHWFCGIILSNHQNRSSSFAAVKANRVVGVRRVEPTLCNKPFRFKAQIFQVRGGHFRLVHQCVLDFYFTPARSCIFMPRKAWSKADVLASDRARTGRVWSSGPSRCHEEPRPPQQPTFMSAKHKVNSTRAREAARNKIFKSAKAPPLLWCTPSRTAKTGAKRPHDVVALLSWTAPRAGGTEQESSPRGEVVGFLEEVHQPRARTTNRTRPLSPTSIAIPFLQCRLDTKQKPGLCRWPVGPRQPGDSPSATTSRRRPSR